MKNKRYLKKIIYFILTVMITSIFSSFSTTEEVNAHKAYKVSFGFNPTSGDYNAVVESEGRSILIGKKTHTDFGLGWNSIHNPRVDTLDGGSDYVSLLANPDASDLDMAKKYAEIYGIDDTTMLEVLFGSGDVETELVWEPLDPLDNYKNLLPLTFPAENMSKGIINDNDATSEDKERALIVANTLTQSINEAVDFVRKNTKYDLTEPKNVMAFTEWLANAVGQMSAKDLEGGTLTVSKEFGDRKIRIEYRVTGFESSEEYKMIMNNKPSYLNESDYMVMAVLDKDTNEPIKTIFIPFRVYKGYNEFDTDRYSPLKKATKSEKKYDDNFITLRQLVIEAHTNYIIFNKTSDTVGSSNSFSGNIFNTIITGFFEFLLTSIRTIFGLYSAYELVFGAGSRATSYFNNLMPVTWYQRATGVFAISMIIAWIMIFSSIAKLSLKRNLSALSNTESRVDMLEGYKNIIITGLLLLCIIPALYIVSLLGNNATQLLKTLSGDGCVASFGTIKGLNTGAIGGVVAGFGLLIFDVYMNFLYIYRSLIAAILYGISPICVAMLAVQGSDKGKTFLLWLKAMLSVIMVPVIHAAVIAVVAPIFCSEYSRTIEVLALLFAFIPITTTISKILGLDAFDGHLVAGLGTAAAGAAASVAFKKTQGKDKDAPSKKNAEENTSNNNNNSNNSSNSGGGGNTGPSSYRPSEGGSDGTSTSSYNSDSSSGGGDTGPSSFNLSDSSNSGGDTAPSGGVGPGDYAPSGDTPTSDGGSSSTTGGASAPNNSEKWKRLLVSGAKVAGGAALVAGGMALAFVGTGMGAGNLGGGEVANLGKKNIGKHGKKIYYNTKDVYQDVRDKWRAKGREGRDDN
ncbi:hypothetical protein [Clostridium sp.]|uniref:hypothetical protein n=1 Tax=Clostridium sp. TaxID=1506 RepID=UPI001B4EE556|nr:hypothetical protein [Clostridium sp.]MBP3915706.1 hypothetical protein [Clostridium sp.]